MAPSRGFITIATGKDVYYSLARNLLASYKYHTRDPLPFAILCDRENEVTREFDDVVIIDSPARAFYDKLRILDLAPYDENIFIDADCLAYSDLNGLWDYFRDYVHPFGFFGGVLPLDSEKSWIDVENAGVFKDRLERQLICQGGIYYVRRDCPEGFKKTVDYIFRNYDSFQFKNSFRVTTADEPIFALACAVHKYYPLYSWQDIFCYYPRIRRPYSLDIRSGALDYVFLWQEESARFNNGKYLLHWGTEHTRGWLYFRETERLISASEGRMFNPVRPAFRYVRANLKSAVRKLLPYKFKVSVYNLFHPPKTQGQ